VVNIFGKPYLISERITQVVNQAKSDVDDDTSPILGGSELVKQNFNDLDIKKIKRKLKELIDNKYNVINNVLTSAQTNIMKNELDLIKITDQVNYVAYVADGYKNNRGGVVVYDLSATTNGTIFTQLVTDFLKVGTDLNTYNQKLDEYKIVPTGTSFTYNTNFNFEMYLTESSYTDVTKQRNVFFMIFGKDVLDGYIKFVDNIISVLEESKKNSWKTYLLSNLGFNYDVNTKVATQRTSGLYSDYVRSKTKTDKLFLDFKTNYLNTLIPNGDYKPYNEIDRIMDYEKQNPLSPVYEQKLRDIYSTVDSDGKYFNLKKTLN
jgi:hypothetical protein